MKCDIVDICKYAFHRISHDHDCPNLDADCQRRGSFTSFASHFRGKRSIDGNVPHRALFSNQTLFAEHDVNVQNVDRTQKYRHHNEEHTEKCNNITEMSMIEKSLNNLHDTESRIDGLESSMLRMKYMVQEMHKKVCKHLK